MFIKEMQHLAVGIQPAFLSKSFAKILTLRAFAGLWKPRGRERNPMGKRARPLSLGVFSTKAGHVCH